MNKGKIYSIEILRIVSMYMIVVLHLLGKGGILDNVETNTVNYFFSNYIENLCFGAVNIYGLISGYVCIFSRSKYCRLINLWFEVIIISVSISTIFYLLPNYHVGKGTFAFSFIPVLSGEYWYFTSYVCVFVAMPFLNKAILSLEKQILSKLLFVGFILLSLFSTIGNFPGGDIFKLSQGYSPWWLIFMYIFGAYMRLYDYGKFKRNVYVVLFFVFSLLNLLSYCCVEYITDNIFPIDRINFMVYNSPFITIASLSIFIFFTKMRINYLKPYILKVSSVSFFVYIISTHPLVFSYIQMDLIKDYANSDPFILILALLILSIIIYISCTIIGLIYKKIFLIIRLPKFSKWLVVFVSKIYNKISLYFKFF